MKALIKKKKQNKTKHKIQKKKVKEYVTEKMEMKKDFCVSSLRDQRRWTI